MRFTFIIILSVVLMACGSDPYVKEVEDYRKGKDQEFIVYPSSPIPEYKRSYFEGLKYYDVNPSAKSVGKFTALTEKDSIVFTTEAKVNVYYKIGKVDFTYLTKPYSLTVLQSKGNNPQHVFIPFRDKTCGKTTYGGGRYLYSKLNSDSTIDLDFNYASNPYCAYNEHFVCFLPPVENTMDVKVEAGEKIYQIH